MSAVQISMIPPKPFGVRSAPVGMTLLILADQDAETHAGLPVTLVAKLMEAENFRFHRVLGPGGRRDDRGHARNPDYDRHGGHQWL